MIRKVDEKQVFKDSTCPEDLIKKYESVNSSEAKVLVLQIHRKNLLKYIHEDQHKLDVLDKLIYELERKGE